MLALYPNPHPPSCPWHAGAELLGAPNIKWCEATVCGWISEPANTWSNVLYLALGLIVYLQCRRSRHAAATSIETMLACANGLRTIARCSIPGSV